ncbi:MAG: hypothetical protein HYV60_19020 [Planctomycetia bacterium]|nr:hypothetical protein [Planctomycetia bacterium]
MQSLVYNKPWRDSDWFKDVLGRCQSERDINSKSYTERFLTPPNYGAVNTYLAQNLLRTPKVALSNY